VNGAGNGLEFATISSYADADVDTHLNTSTASSGEVLSWTGSDYDWVSVGGGSGYTDGDVDTHLNTSTASSGEVLSWNGTDYEWTASGGSYGDASVDTHLNTSTAGNGEVLSWNGSDYDWVAVSSYADSNVDTHLNTSGAGNGEVLSWNGSDYEWVAQSGGSAASRGTATGTSASLANAATGNIDITGFKGYVLLKIETDRAAWVRLYTSAAARTADASRTQGTDPGPNDGVIAEAVTTGAQTVVFSPATFGFNDEGTPTTNIPVAVTNNSGSTSTVQVTLTLIQMEA
jgi:hypothetical protein